MRSTHSAPENSIRRLGRAHTRRTATSPRRRSNTATAHGPVMALRPTWMVSRPGLGVGCWDPALVGMGEPHWIPTVLLSHDRGRDRSRLHVPELDEKDASPRPMPGRRVFLIEFRYVK